MDDAAMYMAVIKHDLEVETREWLRDTVAPAMRLSGESMQVRDMLKRHSPPYDPDRPRAAQRENRQYYFNQHEVTRALMSMPSVFAPEYIGASSIMWRLRTFDPGQTESEMRRRVDAAMRLCRHLLNDPTCVVCGEPVRNIVLDLRCFKCRQAGRCTKCGEPMPDTHAANRLQCGACIRRAYT